MGKKIRILSLFCGASFELSIQQKTVDFLFHKRYDTPNINAAPCRAKHSRERR